MLRAPNQSELPLNESPVEQIPIVEGRRAIEDDDFPVELISKVAEQESWRKEVNRPIYHIHKWWAQRLGSAFRAILIGSLSPTGTDTMRRFYARTRFPDAVVLDPFMGSGTTVGEALKLGCRAIGRDINPVAYFLVRNALQVHPREEVVRTFDDLSDQIAVVTRDVGARRRVTQAHSVLEVAARRRYPSEALRV
ncbi:DNA methyltransferase [Paracoccus sp. (in: a-proteobacteria)]|uniref:DNA methyltransferase n=1 Tax=Paracoccus sp. TaxID=267 RepID=UPI003A8569B7